MYRYTPTYMYMYIDIDVDIYIGDYIRGLAGEIFGGREQVPDRFASTSCLIFSATCGGLLDVATWFMWKFSKSGALL